MYSRSLLVERLLWEPLLMKGAAISSFIHRMRQMFLYVFLTKTKRKSAVFRFKCKKGPYWYGYVRGVKAGQLYGYRVSGPNDPREDCCSIPPSF